LASGLALLTCSREKLLPIVCVQALPGARFTVVFRFLFFICGLLSGKLKKLDAVVSVKLFKQPRVPLPEAESQPNSQRYSCPSRAKEDQGRLFRNAIRATPTIGLKPDHLNKHSGRSLALVADNVLGASPNLHRAPAAGHATLRTRWAVENMTKRAMADLSTRRHYT
jgi:hypothetical protein